MPERRMTEVVRQGQRLGQILVQSQEPRERACDLRDFERMREPRAVVIPFVLHEDLRLVLEPAERRGVDDAVAVALIAGPGRALFLRVVSAPALSLIGRERSAWRD